MKKYFERLYSNSKEKFLEELRRRLEAGKKTFVITANPEFFMLGKKHREIDDILMNSENVIVPDGIGVIMAGRKLGYSFEERIPGVEICEELFPVLNDGKKKLYLFGGAQYILDALVEKLEKEYPDICICGHTNGYVKDKNKVFQMIKKAGPDVVLVALGMPQQEVLISRHLAEFEKGIFIGVGGSFDVLSGKKKRAPEFFVRCNLEWLYRITSEPKRLKRFWDNNIKFLFEIEREKRR